MSKFERKTRRIGNNVEFVDDKGYAQLSYEEGHNLAMKALADCEDMLEDHKNRIMSAVFEKENWLYQQKDKPLEIRAAMYWGALSVAQSSGEIDWDTMRNLFGEFMSKILSLR